MVFVFGMDIPLIEILFVLTILLVIIFCLLVFLIFFQVRFMHLLKTVLGDESVELKLLKNIQEEEKGEIGLLRRIRTELDKLLYVETNKKGSSNCDKPKHKKRSKSKTYTRKTSKIYKLIEETKRKVKRAKPKPKTKPKVFKLVEDKSKVVTNKKESKPDTGVVEVELADVKPMQVTITNAKKTKKPKKKSVKQKRPRHKILKLVEEMK